MTDYRPYSLEQITPPAEEPITLAEAKLYLRVDGSMEDTLIGNMITVARMAAEAYLARSLVTQIWKLGYDDYLLSHTRLLMSPVQSITSVTLVARDDTTTTVDNSTFYLNARKDTLIFDASPFAHRVEVVYVAGYGNASAVPEAIKQGMYLHIAALYANRSAKGAIPDTAITLYAPYRVVRL